MSEFDERFADRVREVFDAYEEPVDEGAWLLMQQRLAAERPATLKLWAPWLMRAAAAVLLLVGGIWLWPRPEAHETAVLAHAPIPQEEQGVVEERVADLEIAGVSRDVPVPTRRQLPISVPEVPVFEREAPPAPEEEPLPVERPENDPVAPLFTHTVAIVQEPEIPPVIERRSGGIQVVAAAMAPIADGRWAAGSGGMVGVANTWSVSDRIQVTAGGGLSWLDVAYAPKGQSSAEVVVSVAQGETAQVDVQRAVTTLGLEFPLLLGLDVARTATGTLRLQGGVLNTLYVRQAFSEVGTQVSGETKISVATGAPEWVVSRQSYENREAVDVLQRADWRQQIQVGLGYTVPRGLGVEVFYRHALGGITSQNLTLNAAGLTVRYGF